MLPLAARVGQPLFALIPALPRKSDHAQQTQGFGSTTVATKANDRG